MDNSVLDIEGKFVVLSLSETIYPKFKVLKVLEKFSKYADVEFEERENRNDVRILPRSEVEDLEIVGRKFMNHLLAEMNRFE